MTDDPDEDTKALLESGATGDELVAALRARDVERTNAADPIFPDPGDVPLTTAEAQDLAERFRALRDELRGRSVAPRSALSAEPGRVASALVMEAEGRMEALDDKELRAAQRELAEAMVDLQSFRPDAQAALILAAPTTPETAEALEALLTARAAIIEWIREDPSVTGNRNALRGLDLRIGDGRRALDAVNSYREKQAFGLLAMVGVAALVIIAVVVFIVIRLSS
jgi:hypothetical protein